MDEFMDEFKFLFCNENFSPWKRLKLFDFVHRTVRTCLIYLISGIGGNLFCGLFNPLSPQVSPFSRNPEF